ncbi:MAG TPA: FAD-binding oxidoreductase [Terrimesophilobacter sp.]|nr:FAD-binding oxidoreductase [Terrimesophilobacter sp.]
MNPQLDLADLRSRVTGPVLAPGEEGFADEVSGFNLATQYSPDVAVGVTNEADVVEAVRFAARHRLPVRVLATGHGPAEPVTDGLLIVTKRLDALEIDPTTNVATVGAGLKWEAVQAAAAPLGLTAITGSSPDVGAVGLTLGGGLGPLVRSHGFTSDYARSFRVVTRAGEAVTASAEENPDLFWALRGGKGGLGVVTELRIRLVELPVIHAGAVIFDTPHIEAVLRGWIDWTASAPDDVTTSVAIVRFPEFEFVPEPLRGHHAIALRFAYPGSEEDGERIAAPLRALAPSIMDTIGRLPTSMMGLIHSDPTDPLPAWDFGLLLASVDQELATALLAQAGAGTQSPLLVTELRHLGGRAAIDVPEGSAAGGRVGSFSFYAVGVPDPSLFESVLPAVGARILEAIAPWTSPETTVNFAGRFRSPEHFASAWPPAIFTRLSAVKKSYDPLGLFTYGPKAG